MWNGGENTEKKEGLNTLVAVAIDKDKASQHALKWAIDHLLLKGQTVVLLHVRFKAPSVVPLSGRQLDVQTKDFFLPFRCFCTRKYIQCKDVILEDTDVARAIIDYTAENFYCIGENRFNKVDIPMTILKGAPEFCSVYIISKGKIASMRSASRQAPSMSALRTQIMNTQNNNIPLSPASSVKGFDRISSVASPTNAFEDIDYRSPFTRGKRPFMKSLGELPMDADVSFVTSGRPSIERSSFDLYDPPPKSQNRLSTSSDISSDYPFDLLSRTSVDCSPPDFSVISDQPSMSWASSQTTDDMEAEMRRLKLELRQTMDLMQEARLAEESALELVEKEKAKSRAAMEAAEAAKRIAQLEAKKRKSLEIKALQEAEERKSMEDFSNSDVNYRKYTIKEIEIATEYFKLSRKIGEGGYGPVFKAHLDHTPVAIKILRPDAAQGRSQFQQEIKVLSRIRHPNMVLLLGACPEYGCLVYEYMHHGSLEDRLFCKGGTPPLPWQHRFRIAAEIATGLLFLHQTKPEPLVHRDLKPANILLDKNLVSKISDVGLARLVPSSVADSVTQYRLTSTAGTFCYIDPEYQQSGMLGVKSDVYSLGILLLQIITAKPPMGLTHYVGRSIEMGTFSDMLDPAISDCPVEEAKSFAVLSLRCSELRRKDRPDLGSVVLPELDRLRMIGEESLDSRGFTGIESFAHTLNRISAQQDEVNLTPSQYETTLKKHKKATACKGHLVCMATDFHVDSSLIKCSLTTNGSRTAASSSGANAMQMLSSSTDFPYSLCKL
ncbi:hypothetical protein V2J09_024112 [Rumex salicifolius]